MHPDQVVTVTVAIIGALALIVTGWFSYRAASRVKTTNGQSAGKLLEHLVEILEENRKNIVIVRDKSALIELWVREHVRAHEQDPRGDG